MLWKELKRKMLRFPEQTVREGDVTWTYAQLICQAEEAAALLRREPTVPCCAVLSRAELRTAAGLLGCLAAGVTAVPLSYRYGEIHTRRILERIEPPALLTDDETGQRLTLVPRPGSYVLPDCHPALLMCTSGTTGRPKGVMLRERNVRSNLRAILRYLPLSAADRILIARPLYHSAVLTGEFLTALSAGCGIRFVSEAFNPFTLLRIIREEGITVMGGTPTLWRILCESTRGAPAFDLQRLIVSGECLSGHVADVIRRRYPAAAVYHVYGLTEASPRVAYLSPELFDRNPACVGRPLHRVRLRIADPTGRPLPRGQAGELLVRGPGVMAGYYEDAGETARVLRKGWLHTGDMAEITPEGLLRIHGRRDDLLIRAGMNLYPAEIENALRADPRVKEVLVYGEETEGEPVRICLSVSGAFTNTEEIRGVCRKLLPAYEMPQKIELLAQLPRTASGKLLRPRKGSTA